MYPVGSKEAKLEMVVRAGLRQGAKLLAANVAASTHIQGVANKKNAHTGGCRLKLLHKDLEDALLVDTDTQTVVGGMNQGVKEGCVKEVACGDEVLLQYTSRELERLKESGSALWKDFVVGLPEGQGPGKIRA